MARATWQEHVIAESDDVEVAEGNVYFPRVSIRQEFFRPSEHCTVCAWRATASYCHIEVNGERNENAARYYPDPKPAAAQINDRIAFWKGVTVERSGQL